MKSFYQRQFAMMAGLILVSFAVLGGVFSTLSYQYTIQEKRTTLGNNAAVVAEFTANYRQQGFDIRSKGFEAFVSPLARISGGHVLLCENDGEIVYSVDGAGDQSLSAVTGRILPKSILAQVLAEGSFAAMTNLGGIYPENRYVTGLPIVIHRDTEMQKVIGLVFVSAETSSITAMWRAFASIFLFTAIVVFLVSFVFTSVTSLRQTRPLKEMAEAVRKFGHGEFSVRVPDYHRQDEVGELAEAFNAMADSLAKAEERRSEFVANVSHELKTPMTTIAGFADGILDGTIPPDHQADSLRTISSETRRLSRLVRRMLDVSRLQSEEGVTAQEQFDSGEIVARVLVSLETKINAKKLDVVADLPEEPVKVWGDPDAITQVCYNLLDNAIKFSHEGGHLWLSVIPGKDGKVWVSVRNEGDTIPPEELPLIFDRFHKTDHSRSQNPEGVGLGLYIVKTILNSHKENITVTSEEGITEFRFSLTMA